jgi:hypothetical protein
VTRSRGAWLQQHCGREGEWCNVTNVSSTLRVRDRPAAVAVPCTSISIPRTFIGLVCNQFELIQIRLKKVNYIFIYTRIYLGYYKFSVCYGPFLKIASPPPPRSRVAQANPFAAQKTPWLAYFHARLRGNVDQLMGSNRSTALTVENGQI